MMKLPSFSQSTEVSNKTLINVIKKVEKCDSLYTDYKRLRVTLIDVYKENLGLIEQSRKLDKERKFNENQIKKLSKQKKQNSLKYTLIGVVAGVLAVVIVN